MTVEYGKTTDPDRHLFVDLDGTLIRTDLLFESLLLLLRRNPLYMNHMMVLICHCRHIGHHDFRIDN